MALISSLPFLTTLIIPLIRLLALLVASPARPAPHCRVARQEVRLEGGSLYFFNDLTCKKQGWDHNEERIKFNK